MGKSCVMAVMLLGEGHQRLNDASIDQRDEQLFCCFLLFLKVDGEVNEAMLIRATNWPSTRQCLFVIRNELYHNRKHVRGWRQSHGDKLRRFHVPSIDADALYSHGRGTSALSGHISVKLLLSSFITRWDRIEVRASSFSSRWTVWIVSLNLISSCVFGCWFHWSLKTAFVRVRATFTGWFNLESLITHLSWEYPSMPFKVSPPSRLSVDSSITNRNQWDAPLRFDMTIQWSPL